MFVWFQFSASGAANSKMLDATTFAVLKGMLPVDCRTMTVLLPAAGGSYNTNYKNANFWGAVYGKGKILIVMQHLASGYVFGAYVEDTFNAAGPGWITGNSANFIFRLTGTPVKLLYNGGSYGVWMSNSYSVGFQMGEGGDLVAFYSTTGLGRCTPGTYTTTAPGYTLPSPLVDGTLCGAVYNSGLGYAFTGTEVAAEIYQCSSP